LLAEQAHFAQTFYLPPVGNSQAPIRSQIGKRCYIRSSAAISMDASPHLVGGGMHIKNASLTARKSRAWASTDSKRISG